MIFKFEIFKIRLFERLTLAGTRAVICCNALEAEWYSIFAKVIYIPNGTNFHLDKNNGMVPLEEIIGRVAMRIWPINRIGGIEN